MMRRAMATVMAAVFAAQVSAAGGSGAAFLKISPSVRGEALGGFNPAVSSGAQAAGVNPANASVLDERFEFTSGFATMIGQSQYGQASFMARRGEGAVGASVVFLRSAELEGRDASGNVTQTFRSQDMAAGLTAATGGESFRMGVTAKAVRQSLGDMTSNTAPAADVGISFKTGGVSWGASALNLGGGVKFQDRSEPLPAVYSLGASVPLGGGLTGLVGAGRFVKDKESFANFGVEYQLSPLNLRLGYRSQGADNLALKSQKSGGQALAGLAAGIGVSLGHWRLDYAVSQTAVEWGLSHRAALTFHWGGDAAMGPPPVRERVYAQPRTSRPAPAAKKAAPRSVRPEPKTVVKPALPTVKPQEKKVYRDPAPAKKPQKKKWVE